MYAEKARIAQIKTGIKWIKVAERMGVKSQGLVSIFKKDNCTEETMKRVADALGCDLEITLIIRETGERV